MRQIHSHDGRADRKRAAGHQHKENTAVSPAAARMRRPQRTIDKSASNSPANTVGAVPIRPTGAKGPTGHICAGDPQRQLAAAWPSRRARRPSASQISCDMPRSSRVAVPGEQDAASRSDVFPTNRGALSHGCLEPWCVCIRALPATPLSGLSVISSHSTQRRGGKHQARRAPRPTREFLTAAARPPRSASDAHNRHIPRSITNPQIRTETPSKRAAAEKRQAAVQRQLIPERPRATVAAQRHNSSLSHG